MPLSISPDNIGIPADNFKLPFAEQIAFFRQKLNLPTESWDDILKSAHDRAFIVAGVAKADLLNDLRVAVDAAIAEGKTIQWFRKEFDNIVAKNGWTGWTGEGSKAGKAWRTRVIYQTNLSTSYAAGRYQQLNDPDLLKARPYWKYIHSDLVTHPRPLHQSWNGVVLPYDNAWWKTHFCPNGWGCRCRIMAVRASEYKGKSAPNDGTYDYINKSTGEIITLPKGIDYGWDYAPGANVTTQFTKLITDKLISVNAPIGSAMMESLKPVLQAEINQSFVTWIDDVLKTGVSRNSMSIAGWITNDVLLSLKNIGKIPDTAEIVVEDRLIVGKKAARHENAGDALSIIEWKNIPILLAASPKALFDNDTGKVLYVLPSPDSKTIKLVVELDFKAKKQQTLNSVRSAFKINANALQDKRRYTPLN